MDTTATNYLTRMLEPVMDCFTPEVAARLVNLHPDPVLVARMEVLASKANEGQLTADERAEYRDYIEADDLIGILQAKARSVLARENG